MTTLSPTPADPTRDPTPALDSVPSPVSGAAAMPVGVGGATVEAPLPAPIPDRSNRVAFRGPYEVLGQTIRPLLTAAETGGQYSLFDLVVQPGAGVPPHVHAWEDESWYGLEGELEITLDGQSRRVGPGDVVYGPRGRPHSFVNRGMGPARLVLTCTPGGFEHFFAEAHGVCAQTSEMEAVLACVRRHGMVM